MPDVAWVPVCASDCTSSIVKCITVLASDCGIILIPVAELAALLVGSLEMLAEDDVVCRALVDAALTVGSVLLLSLPQPVIRAASRAVKNAKIDFLYSIKFLPVFSVSVVIGLLKYY